MWHKQPGEQGQSGYAELPASSNADRTLYAPELGLFGVFDGVGSTGAPAAEIAANYVRTHGEKIVSARGLATVLEGANTAILENPAAYVNEERRSETTATVFKVIPTLLGAHAIWASVGDTRLYHVSQQNSAIEQISRDEGQEEYILNGLGWADCKVEQCDTLKLRRGDGLILVTDGVTGDRDDDIMPDNEVLLHYRAGYGDAGMAASALVHNARKQDDRTAVVLQI